MSHRADVELWHRYARAKGIKPDMYHAPMDKLIETLGLRAPPTLFWRYYSVVIITALPFAICMGITAYFVKSENLPTVNLILSLLISSFLFGAVMGVYHWSRRKRLGLSTWQAFINDSKNNF